MTDSPPPATDSLPPASGEIDAMLRVDHAGEYGAVRIYQGQLDVLAATSQADALRHMLDNEKEHFAAFETLLRERGVRPTVLQPLWRVAGYALGAFTALLGPPSAMACTVAVEDVIDDHYAEQERRLAASGDEEHKSLHAMIAKFRADEQEHHDMALRRQAEQAPFYPLLSAGIKAASRLAIWLSTRF